MAYIGKSPTGSGVRTRYYYTATGGETSISGADDNGRTLSFTDAEYVDVYMNGVLLVHGTDYGTGTANTISSLAPLSSGDIIEIVVYDIYTVAKINSEAARRRYYYTATGGETSVSGTDDNGQTITFAANSEIEVKVNGISIVQGSDFNTSVANTVGGLSPLTVGQVVEIVVYERFVLTDTVSKRDGGTFNNNIVVEGNITTTGNIVNGGDRFIYSYNGGTSGQVRSGIFLDGTNERIDFYVDQNSRMSLNSSGNVGIGTTPSAPLHVKSTAANSKFILEHTSPSIGTGQYGTFVGSDGNVALVFDNNSAFSVGASSNPVNGAGYAPYMSIDSSGRVTKPAQPAFMAWSPATTSQGNLVRYTATRSNVGGHYSTSTGLFTAPVDGHYNFYFNLLMVATTAQPYVRVWYIVNGSKDATRGDTLAGGTTTAWDGWSYIGVGLGLTHYLYAGDTIGVWNDGPHTTYGPSYGAFSGFLIG
jgi:hypothetical protein